MHKKNTNLLILVIPFLLMGLSACKSTSGNNHKNNNDKNTEKSYILPSGEKLTKRQREVLNYLRQGLSNKQIAGKMDISEPTVKLHIHGLFYKLGATNRTQIILKASELSLI